MSAMTSAVVISPISRTASVVLNQTAHRLHGVAHQHVGGDRRGMQLLFGGLDPRHDQQVFGQTIHAGRVLQNGGQKLAGLLAERGLMVEQRLDVAARWR